MSNQKTSSIIPLVAAAVFGTVMVHSLRKEVPAKKWYTPQCHQVVEKEWVKLDKLCGVYPTTATEINYEPMKILIEERDRKLKLANCNPKCEIWYCYPGYQRHYGAMEPNC